MASSLPFRSPDVCLGGNVFGWTADEDGSFAVLDAALDAGIDFIDTADSYIARVHGVGGQSETIIGRWLISRATRSRVAIATKVGKNPGFENIRPDTIRAALDASLARLQTDYVDLYYAHDDDGQDLAESLATFDELIRAGKIRSFGLSNFSAQRVREAAAICARDGLTAPAAMQPEYSLVERGYEHDLQGAAADTNLAVFPYWALAGGFLTGKYRPGGPDVDSVRAGRAARYLQTETGPRILAAVDEVAAAHSVPFVAVALAWTRANPTIVAPVASARTPEQVGPLADSIGLTLSQDELDALDAASRA